MRRAAWIVVGALAVGSSLLGLASRAGAQPPAREPIRVAYAVLPECPGEGRFFEEILARTDKARRAAPGEEARTLRVGVLRDEDGLYEGSVVFEEGSRGTTPRRISGATCAEVVAALGLVAALAIDPAARTAPVVVDPPAGPGPGAGAPPRGPGAAAAASASMRTDPAPDGGATGASPGSASMRTDPAPDGGAPRSVSTHADSGSLREPASGGARWRLGAGAHGDLSSAVGALFAGRLHVGLEREGAGLFSPAARLSVARSVGARADAGTVGALFTLSTARLEGCPVAFALDAVARVLLRGCAAFEGGLLEGEGRGVSVPQARARPWLAAGVLARAGWAVTSWLVLELQVSGFAPFLRERFLVDGATEVHRAPGVVAAAGLGFSLRLP